MPNKPARIVIVGGGWAGLSCAVELVSLGHQVTVLESARQLGGRARRVAFGKQSVDNGQHILLGAYQCSFEIFKRININLSSALHRQKLDLAFRQLKGKTCRFHLPHLLSPLNLLMGLFQATGLNPYDRWRALVFGFRLFTNSVMPEQDISVAKLLVAHKQTPASIRMLWEPICLAALNTPIDEASSAIFTRVLHDSFCRNYRDADLLLPRVDLGSLLPDHASEYIETHGGFVHLSQRVSELTIEQQQIINVKTPDKTYSAEHVVLATPPHVGQVLLKSHPALHDIAYNLSGFDYHPICTLYLQYPPDVKLARPLQGLLGTTAQWLIDRRITNQPGLIAAVISGPGKHTQLDNAQLTARIETELQQLYPRWPAAQSSLLIREKRACFNARVGINAIRPGNRTPIKGLWLAGDYTNTGYPATIESAVISAQQAAHALHQEVINT